MKQQKFSNLFNLVYDQSDVLLLFYTTTHINILIIIII